MNKRISKAINAYLTEAPNTVKIHKDPKVAGVYAARAETSDGPVDFLFNKNDADEAESDDEALEECDFESWPPVSGELKFF